MATAVTTRPAPLPLVRICVLGALGRGALRPSLPAPTWSQAPGVPAASDPTSQPGRCHAHLGW